MKIHCLIIEPDPKKQTEYNLLFHGLIGMFKPTIVVDVRDAIKALTLSYFSIIIYDPFIIGKFIEELHLFLTDNDYFTRIIIVSSDNRHENMTLTNSALFTEIITRPLTTAKVAGKILLAFKNRFYQGYMKGFPLTSILQLIKEDKLTCTVRLSTPNSHDEGLIFFQNSKPVDAQYGDMQTDMALIQIFSLKNPAIEMYKICPVRKNRLQANCFKLILNYSEKQPEITFTPKNLHTPTVTGIASLYTKVQKDKS